MTDVPNELPNGLEDPGRDENVVEVSRIFIMNVISNLLRKRASSQTTGRKFL